MAGKYAGFELQTARRIARVCSDRHRGLQEVATALGREPGSLAGTIDKMLAHGDLHSDADPDIGRRAGTLFWVDESQLERAELAAAQAQDPGLVREGQPLLVLRCPDAAASVAVLRSSLVGAAVVWAARISGDGTVWLIALDAEGEQLVVDQLDVAASKAGGSVASFSALSVMDGTALRRYLRAVGAAT